MPAMLRDQVWQFIGAAFGFVAIIVSVVLYWTQRRRKALSYEIISRTPLLSVEDEVKGRVQILFDGNPVQDIHLVVLKLINSGNVSIISADYERPISFSFGKSAQILSAEVVETNPRSLRATIDIENTKVVLEPILLNGGDSITLKMLISQLDDQISVDGRIMGVKDIKATARQGQNLLRFLAQVMLVFGAGVLLVGLSMVGLGTNLDSPDAVDFGARLIFWGVLGMIVIVVLLSQVPRP